MMEIGLSSSRNMNLSSTHISLLIATNSFANHILNVACAIADAGAVGAILWSFEARELTAEVTEHFLGARMHAHLALSEHAFTSNVRFSQYFSNIIEILNLGGISLRINRSRLLANLQITADNFSENAITGPMAMSSGIEEITVTECSGLTSSSLGGLTSDSLLRHILRCDQMII